MILCIQMELCKQNLLTLINDRNERNISFPSTMVNNIGTQILKGLDYLHALDIIHHDINVRFLKLISVLLSIVDMYRLN